MPLHVELVSPEEAVWSGEASMVIGRTVGGGDIAWMTGHAPFLGALDTCVIRVQLIDNTIEKIAVKGGFIEVSNDSVKILSDQAEKPEHVDPDRARVDLQWAEEELRKLQAQGDGAGGAALAEAEEAVRWHKLRLDAAGHGAPAAGH